MMISLLGQVRARRLQTDEAGATPEPAGAPRPAGALPTRVLLIAETMSATSLLRRALWDRGLTIDVVPPRDARRALEIGPDYNLVVLDLLSSRCRGDLVCRHMRDAASTSPILVLGTGYPSEDPSSLFDAGADAYVAEPIDFDELRARVDALLRRAYLRLVRATPG